MNKRADWTKEFEEFLQTPPEAPPLSLSHAIISRVRDEFFPSPMHVFFKVVACVGITGLVSLLACPQFGFGGTEHSKLQHVFVEYLGAYGCSIACGAFFSVFGVMVASLMLSRSEVRVLRNNEMMMLSAVSAFFLAAFVCLGATVLFESAALWFLGSWIGSMGSLEAVSALRFHRSLSSMLRL